jgi:peptidoglycan/xylan/chitin deacetylase (PgdA/CDA1 family)
MRESIVRRILESRSPSVRDRPGGRSLAILAYHKIGEAPPGGWQTWFYVPEESFVGHLTYLREHGWQVIDLLTLLRGIAAPESLPERAVLLTFDDGYRSMRTVALPWLLRFGYPAVLFVPTDYIGGFNGFDVGYEPEEAICDWDDLQELEHSGVSIQSHGASHRSFSKLGLPEQVEELVRSKITLEAGLEKPVEVLAYPYGDGGTEPQTGKALEHAGYRAACLYKGGPNPLPIVEPYRLTRLAMGPDTDLQVELKEDGTDLVDREHNGVR